MSRNPEEFKRVLLSMKPDDITKTFIQENFGNMYDEKTKKIINSNYNPTFCIT